MYWHYIFLYLAKFKRTYELSFVCFFEFGSSRLLLESKIIKNTLVSNGCYEDAATSWEDRQEVLRDLSKKQAANVIYLLASLGGFFKQ